MNCAVGSVSEADVAFAEATGAEILAFHSRPLGSEVETLARVKNVTIHQHTVIYHLLDAVGQSLLQSAPECEDEEILGEAEVLQIFPVKSRKCFLHQFYRITDF